MTSEICASVVVPTYERPSKLESLLESVCSQTVDYYEVIVVDDGSKLPRQHAILNQFEGQKDVHVIRQENGGPATARNRGWQHATGEFILFTDDDCIVPRKWVETLVEGFEDGVAAVGGDLVPSKKLMKSNMFARAHRFRDEMAYQQPKQPTRGRGDLAVGGTANVAYRQSVLDEMNGFDESFPLAAGEDADLQRRVVDAGYDMKFVPISVRHNDDYNWSSFVNRAIRSGEGTHHFNQKYNINRSVLRILLGMVGSLGYFPIAVRRSGKVDVAILYVLERVFSRFGELKSAINS
ncbi:glycosyltransferase family 2 protein [Haloferax sp. KTX1]|uniref:glycosyltransferase n=1 Tax=Haloferax sp. KTX1 TaxID=2600597 RepID=UPI00165236B7|nr:glycosyltransferase [Haloferax sp. KTX1]